MMFSIRPFLASDLVHIQDCDVKCFDYGWDADEWKFVAENYAIRVASFYGTPIGFAAMVVVTEPERIAHLFKLGVKPNFRRRKVGRLLVNSTIEFAKSQDLNEIEAIVPEGLCRPKEPQCITGWLAKVGFMGTGVVPNYIHNMGVVEDGFKFNLRF